MPSLPSLPFDWPTLVQQIKGFVRFTLELVLRYPVESLAFLGSLCFLLGLLLVVRHRRHPETSPSTGVYGGQSGHSVQGEPGFGQGQGGGSYPRTQRVRANDGRRLQSSMDDLLDIEEALLALRELYWRKLIPASVYIEESLKVGARVKA